MAILYIDILFVTRTVCKLYIIFVIFSVNYRNSYTDEQSLIFLKLISLLQYI